MADDVLEVQVAYAKPEEQYIVVLEVEQGTTLEQAIERSGILARYPEIDSQSAKVGIFGKAASRTTKLSAGDRVEIYRPLIADPKEARKKRAAEGKSLKKGGG